MIARAALGGLLLTLAAAGVSAQTLSVQVDNDEFAGLNKHDRWYSQSLRAHGFRPALADGPVARMADAWCGLQACDAGATRTARWSMRKPRRPTRCRRDCVAAQRRAMFPVFCGISGSTRQT